ncbi:MAG TPA: serine hydrolase [Terriglobales bacterium]|nr:serine hydrolase [Terriglobales bacterium]
MNKIFLAVMMLCVLYAQAQSTPPAASEKQRGLKGKLEETIKDVDRRLDGYMGVAILDLTNGETMYYHADEVFPTASSIKVALLAELYRQAEKGTLNLTDTYIVRKEDDAPDSAIFNGLTPGVTKLTLRDLAQMVVAVSDNAATNVLIDKVGMQNVNAMLHDFTLTKTKLQRKMMDVNAAKEGRENVSTPRELMMLMEAIYRGKVANQQLTNDLLKMLSTSKSSPMQRALGESVRVADKPGELDAVRCDFGVVYAPNRPFVIAVMTTFLKDMDEGETAIVEVTQAAYNYFDRLGRSSYYGRAMAAPEP